MAISADARWSGTAIARLAVLAACLAAAEPFAARAQQPYLCAPDLIVGQIRLPASVSYVSVTHNGQELPRTVPTCLEPGDVVAVPEGKMVLIETANGPVTTTHWSAPPAEHDESNIGGFLNALITAVVGPTRTISFHAAARGGASCAPGQGVPPPLARLRRASGMEQVIGTDLRALVVAWRPVPEPRLVRARLVRADGSLVVRAATCAGSSLVLPLAAGALREAERLGLELADDRGSTLHYDILVVAPDSLPVPRAGATGWLVAAWRLAAGQDRAGLDSISRVASMSETSFGAQRVLGAALEDAPF